MCLGKQSAVKSIETKDKVEEGCLTVEQKDTEAQNRSKRKLWGQLYKSWGKGRKKRKNREPRKITIQNFQNIPDKCLLLKYKDIKPLLNRRSRWKNSRVSVLIVQNIRGGRKTLQTPKKKKITDHNNFQLHNNMTLERKENSLPWGILTEDDL